jgi:predicted nucleic acid-binding protein
MRTFVDTSTFFALLDRDDANHKKARDAWAQILNPEHILVTSNYVLVETFALLQNRIGLSAVRGFQEDIIPLINIEFVTSSTHRAGVASLLSAARRNLSFVDCVSFEVMRIQGIRSAFTFDPHFKEQGFIVIP